MATLDEIKEKVATIIKDTDSKLSPSDIEHCLADALEHFNKELPRLVATKYPATGSDTDYDLPASWDEDFSTIRAIEFPIDQNPPTFLTEDEYKLVETEVNVVETGDTDNELSNWDLEGVVFNYNTDSTKKMYVTLSLDAGSYKVQVFKDSGKTKLVAEGSRVGDGTITLAAQNNSGLSGTVDVAWTDGETGIVLSARNKVIRFISAPGTNEYFRLLWTKRIKELNDYGVAQIEDRHLGAFAQLGAHYCAKALAFLYANTSDPTLDADVVDYKAKTTYYEGLADKTLEEFEQVSLRGSARIVPHGVKDLDLRYHWNEEKLFHRDIHR